MNMNMKQNYWISTSGLRTLKSWNMTVSSFSFQVLDFKSSKSTFAPACVSCAKDHVSLVHTFLEDCVIAESCEDFAFIVVDRLEKTVLAQDLRFDRLGSRSTIFHTIFKKNAESGKINVVLKPISTKTKFNISWSTKKYASDRIFCRSTWAVHRFFRNKRSD